MCLSPVLLSLCLRVSFRLAHSNGAVMALALFFCTLSTFSAWKIRDAHKAHLEHCGVVGGDCGVAKLVGVVNIPRRANLRQATQRLPAVANDGVNGGIIASWRRWCHARAVVHCEMSGGREK